MNLFTAIVATGVLLVGLHARIVTADDITLDWMIKSYPVIVGNSVGDTVTFNWEGEDTHNVFIHPTHSCDFTDRTLVGWSGPASHTFTEAGTITFSCDISNGSHCADGQIVSFEVSAATTTGDGDADHESDATSSDVTIGGGLVGDATDDGEPTTGIESSDNDVAATGGDGEPTSSSSASTGIDSGDDSGASSASGVATALVVAAAGVLVL